MVKLLDLVIPANLQVSCAVRHFQALSRVNACTFAGFESDEEDTSVRSCRFAGFYSLVMARIR